MQLKNAPFAIGLVLAAGTLALGFGTPPTGRHDIEVAHAASAQRDFEYINQALELPEISGRLRDIGYDEITDPSREQLGRTLERIRSDANRRQMGRLEYIVTALILALAGAVITQWLTILTLRRENATGDPPTQ